MVSRKTFCLELIIARNVYFIMQYNRIYGKNSILFVELMSPGGEIRVFVVMIVLYLKN